ncbi:MAG TPA: alpha-L-fucosidase, partial [Bacteroidota bacterium]|nr:alpha-L-fucosidase [Bacteroidota bacterium]
MKSFLVAVLFLAGACAFSGERESPDQKTERLRWWREDRFGMFVSWGPVSIEGAEISWSRGGEKRGTQGTGVIPGMKEIPVEIYDNLYKQFNPVLFNAEEWVSIAKAAGMRYMVLIAKHCDGFCMWKSKIDSYSMAATPFGRDVCGELARAAHNTGMKI